jgi:hypothetical protein
MTLNIDKSTELLRLVSIVTNISEADILSTDRKASYVLSRQIIAYFLRHKYNYKLQQIGKVFKTHHTTILNSLSKIANMIDINDQLTLSIMSELEILISQNEELNCPKTLTVTLKPGQSALQMAKILEEQYDCIVLIN